MSKIPHSTTARQRPRNAASGSEAVGEVLLTVEPTATDDARVEAALLTGRYREMPGAAENVIRDLATWRPFMR